MAQLADELPTNSKVDVSWKTFLRLTTIVLILLAVVKLSEVLGLILIGALLGTTFYVVIEKLTAIGLKRWLAISIVVLSVIAVVAAIVLLLVPAIIAQAHGIAESLPAIKQQLTANVPEMFRTRVAKLINHPDTALEDAGAQLFTIGSAVFAGAASLLASVILGFYFLFEGEKTFVWLISFFGPVNRRKLYQTGSRLKEIITAYVVGQIITSLFVAVYTTCVLLLLHVPAALIMGVLVGILDVIPAIGVMIAVVIACMLALTVSLPAVLGVLGAFVLYSLIENYVVTPLVYGRKMKLSNLAVILSIAVGAKLFGGIGILLALPIAAAYPVVEQIWLRRQLGDEVVERHKALEN
jgi:predicted PurR-regulated permease PerM